MTCIMIFHHPEKFEISENMLSEYCFNIANEYRIKIGGVNKLVPNLGNKSKYVVHYRNLQFSLQKSSVVFVIRNETDGSS